MDKREKEKLPLDRYTGMQYYKARNRKQKITQQ